MNNTLQDILYIILSTVLSVGGAIVIYIIKEKTGWKYRDEIAAAVSTAVGFVQQTYVDELKKDGIFCDDEQEQARNMACVTVKALLTAGAKEYLNKQGDKYLIYLIENAVRKQKKEEV